MRCIVLLVTMVALMSVVAAGVACAAKIYGTNGSDRLNHSLEGVLRRSLTAWLRNCGRNAWETLVR
jgi:hypothetical protein